MSALLQSDVQSALRRELEDDPLVIEPMLDPVTQIGPASVDLRLGTRFIEVDRSAYQALDPIEDDAAGTRLQSRRRIVPLGDKFMLHPNQLVLGSTLEFIGLPGDIVGQVLSRSSWGRLGLLVATAVTIQPGFRGVLTLELVNTGPIPVVLRPGLRIAQMVLWRSGASIADYRSTGTYLGSTGPEEPRSIATSEETERLRAISRAMAGLRSPLGPPGQSMI